MSEKKSVRVELRLLLYYVVALGLLYLVLLGHEVVQRTTFKATDSLTNWIIALASLTSAFGGIGAFIFVYRTFEINRLALESAQYNAAVDHRPIVSFQSVSIQQNLYSSEMRDELTIAVMNKGNSAAQNVSCSFVIGSDLQGDLDDAKGAQMSFEAEDVDPASLSSGGVVIQNADEVFYFEIKNLIKSKSVYNFIFIRLDYEYNYKKCKFRYRLCRPYKIEFAEADGGTFLVSPLANLTKFSELLVVRPN